ncbi:glycosyl transferase, group 1 [Thermosulfidibacter takaii ABI70S6]|uniref:Glycosyl transferase, group 1 n=1 Tax=Thermosulfidibacter takaii (strain DSM 17441 / JCM 13301 / NBRC 103674 / ABI70S6) TaxID=1298851 RepID=A0A0S3QSY4_THET7|nr:glycosyltransferase family 4 protein [Thermosulfidibacter takaii]BAT71420.1 glycosyl transferase, group 1 [Thermosulfidibacter takaii ABI70S6]
MRIAQVAPLVESVPPKLYGGTERVVSYITEELVKRGHEVVLFASGDSVTSAELVPIVPEALRLAGIHNHEPYTMMELEEVFKRADEFDIIHCHVDYFAFPFTRFTLTPTVHTMHGRLDLPFYKDLMKRYADIPLVSISDSQRLPLPEANFVATVYHGLPRDLYSYSDSPENYVLFLGRISPEKRPDLAIKAAVKAGIKIKIAAKIDVADREYYEKEIKHLMGHPLVEYIGEVNDREKNELIGKALALMMPIDWPEPFGLTAIEALACGTPVIARPCGALPEIIVDGKVGFLRRDLDGLVDAIKQVEKIDRAECRRHFERKFTVERMVDDYERVYQKLVKERVALAA